MKIHNLKLYLFRQPSGEDRSTSSLFFMFANSGMQIHLILLFGRMCPNKIFLHLKWKEKGFFSVAYE